MFRTLITGSMALLLLAASTAVADDATDVQVGPVRVRVQAGAANAPAKAVQVQVQPGAVKASANPVQVQVQPGLVPNVFVQAPNTRVRVHAGAADAATAEIKLPDYWIGLTCHPADPPLRVQLGLPEGHGLIVDNVMPEGPAAAAGIQQHDVMVAIGEKPLASLEDLVKAIDAAKETEMAVEIYRGGKKQTVKLTPAKRPEQPAAVPAPAPHGEDWDRIQKWIEQLHAGRPERLHFFGPGVILPPHAKVSPPLPGNMTVVITKTGDDPAAIVVTRGQEKWEVTEEELDKLPKDVRRHVKGILGHHAGEFSINLSAPGVPRLGIVRERAGSAEVKPQPAPRRAEPPKEQLNKQLDEMQQRIEAMQKSLEQIRSQPADPPAEEDQPDQE